SPRQRRVRRTQGGTARTPRHLKRHLHTQRKRQAMRKKFVAGSAAAVSGALVLSACGGGGPSTSGGEVTDDKVVLAVVNDQTGIYRDWSGPNSITAVEMAIADYQEKYGDDAEVDEIEVISGDHQNEPDVANTLAQQMYDRDGA